ncbi:hypothetical protein GGI23_005449 [Coemansia sp. RSA 2559]|nr:hypothetical protein GGI23_005449 [Coemansia sp. RSA 2559]
MKNRVCVLAMAYMGYAVAHNGPHSTNCTPGAYRCHGPGGQSAAFLQCDASGSEVLKACAPGTVCYAEGTDSILCSFPVNTANGPPPASGSLVAGAQCSSASPFDEYMCPGPNGQYSYYLRCLSGTFVHFPCPPGTACHKTEGQNMVCSQSAAGAGGSAGASSMGVPEPPASSPSSDAMASASSSGMDNGMQMGMGSSSSSSSLSATDALEITSSGSTSTSDWLGNLPPLFSESTTSTSSSSSEGLPSDILGGSEASVTHSATGSATDASSDSTTPPSSSSSSSSVEPSSVILVIPETPATHPATDASSEVPSPEEGTPSTASPESASANPPPTQSNGLTGPVISSGLEMLLNNGVQLPFTLPNIDLPAIDLATVHLPDLTFDGIALTAIPLPSVIIPPLNPASLTHFTYIESIMSKAGISFDDLAKLKLPDLSHIDMSALGHIDPAMIMSLVNVNRAPVPTEQSNANDIAGPVPTASPQTTTLGTDAIDALLGLSVITFSASA